MLQEPGVGVLARVGILILLPQRILVILIVVYCFAGTGVISPGLVGNKCCMLGILACSSLVLRDFLTQGQQGFPVLGRLLSCPDLQDY